MLDLLGQQLMEQWTATVVEAPLMFGIALFLALFLLGIAIFLVLEWFHREKVATLEQKVETQEKRISLFAELTELAKQRAISNGAGVGRNPAEIAAPSEAPLNDVVHDNKACSSPQTIQNGLYVCHMRFTFACPEKDSELTMRVFNGSGGVVKFSPDVRGGIIFHDTYNKYPDYMGILPSPALRDDTPRTVSQWQESSLTLTQQVPDTEAKKLLAMLENDIPILLDLNELTIEVVGQHDRNKVERLPIWNGINYNPSHQHFGRVHDLNIDSTGGLNDGYR